MQFAPLSAVKHRIRVGIPLPFNIRNADHTLLLARGQVIANEAQLEALFERGALVDAVEAKTSARTIVHDATPDRLPGMWGTCIEGVGRTLKAGVHKDFATALEEASKPVLALIERDPDLAIFQVVRQGAVGKTPYGVSHSMHTAIATFLAASRLGWSEAETHRAFKASLTMNLSMIELQNRLATQVTPLTQNQREAIQTHPVRSAEMLEESGISDADWLRGVMEHHEVPDGSGYPRHVNEVCDIAALLRRVDIYTAKLSARITRSPLAANEAGRELFMRDQGHPMTAAIVKEFGVYPPGCYVRLSCGEIGIVIKRGATATTPLVAALTNRSGDPLVEPVRRNSAQREFAIVSVVSESAIRVRVSPERLVLLAAS